MKKSIILILSLLIIFVGCSSSNEDTSTYNSSENTSGEYYDDELYSEEADLTTSEDSDNTSESGQDSKKDGRKLIVSYTITGESQNYDQVIEEVNTLVDSYDGYSLDLREESTGSRSLNVLLRIPSDIADDFVDDLSNIENLNIYQKEKSSSDITSSYFDAETRLASLRSKLARLEEIRNLQGTVEDLLVVEGEINSTIFEIESIEARLNNYDQLVDYTEIRLNIFEVTAFNEVVTEEPNFGDRLQNAFNSTFRSTKLMVQNIIIGLIVLLPRLIILAIIIFIIYKLVRFLINRGNKQSDSFNSSEDSKNKEDNYNRYFDYKPSDENKDSNENQEK